MQTRPRWRQPWAPRWWLLAARDAAAVRGLRPDIGELRDCMPELAMRIVAIYRRFLDEPDRFTLGMVAAAAAFLLTDDSSYITGQSLRVDGGVTTDPALLAKLQGWEF